MLLGKKSQFQGCSTNPNNPGSSKLAMMITQKRPIAIHVPTKGTLFIGRFQNVEVETTTFFVSLVKGISDSPIFKKETRRLLNGKTLWWRIFWARIIKHL